MSNNQCRDGGGGDIYASQRFYKCNGWRVSQLFIWIWCLGVMSGLLTLDTDGVAARVLGESGTVRRGRGLTLFAHFPDGLATRGVDLALQIKLNFPQT